VLGACAWSAVEKRLAPLLAFALSDAELHEQALRLLDATEAKLRDGVRARAATIGLGFRYAWSETIRFYGGVLSHPKMLPCTEMLIALQRRMLPFSTNSALTLVRSAMLERASASPPSDFAINFVLEDHYAIASNDRIAANLDLIESAWKSGIGTHLLNALHAFPSMRLALREGDPTLMTRALAILDSFTSSNMILDSLIVETKSIFETIPPPVSVEDALAAMRRCISSGAANDPSLAFLAEYQEMSVLHVLSGLAYGYVGRIFEDVFQGAYYEAYTALDDNERLALLSLAAQEPQRGFHSDWILRELLNCNVPQTLLYFEANLSAVDFTSSFLQVELATALTAIEACARWSSAPPMFGTTTPEYRAAFDAVGHALFVGRREDAPSTAIDAIRAKWRALDSDERLSAGAILQSIRNANNLFTQQEHDVQTELAMAWPEEIETVMLDCIVRRDEFSMAFARHNFDGNLIKRAIETVGNVGSGRSLATLRALSDDPAVGVNAVGALAKLQRRGIGVT
jgi:hypothetical protein